MSKVTNSGVFAVRRLCKFVDTFRSTRGVFPTLSELVEGGFSKQLIRKATKGGYLTELYTDMTTGAVIRVYRVKR